MTDKGLHKLDASAWAAIQRGAPPARDWTEEEVIRLAHEPGHLSNESVMGYVGGTLDAPARAAVERHTAACDYCRQQLLAWCELADPVPPAGPVAEAGLETLTWPTPFLDTVRPETGQTTDTQSNQETQEQPNGGNPLPPWDDAVRPELIAFVYERLRLLARDVWPASLPDLAAGRPSGSGSPAPVVHLLKELNGMQPRTVRDFYVWAAARLRQTLAELARHPGIPAAWPDEPFASLDLPGPEEARDRAEPARRSQWLAFHERMARLPEDEQKVLDLRLYLGLTETVTARVLGMGRGRVADLWVTGRRNLQPRGVDKPGPSVDH